MSNDWTDPDEAERELKRREASNGEPNRSAQQDRELLLEILEELKEFKDENASLREDIASLRHEVAKRENERSAPGRPPIEDVLGKHLAETEGRIVGHVDRVDESVRPVVDALPDIRKSARIAAALPEALRNLDATVGRQTEAIQGQTLASKSSSNFLDQLGVDLKDMVRENGLRLEAQFAAEAKETREWHKEVIATVRKRHRRARRFWLSLAVAVMIGMLASVAGGVWLQWEHEPLSPKDPTLGWRDYIWNEHGATIVACIEEMRKDQARNRLPALATAVLERAKGSILDGPPCSVHLFRPFRVDRWLMAEAAYYREGLSVTPAA